MDLLEIVLWDKDLKQRVVQESWLVFKDHLLQAAERSILMSRTSGKKIRRPAWMKKGIQGKLRLESKCSKGESRERWPSRESAVAVDTQLAAACRHLSYHWRAGGEKE